MVPIMVGQCFQASREVIGIQAVMNCTNDTFERLTIDDSTIAALLRLVRLLFTVEDIGICPDAPFARLLGQEEPSRGGAAAAARSRSLGSLIGIGHIGGITDDNLWRPTRRAEEHYTKDKLSTRRGAVHSIGWLSFARRTAEECAKRPIMFRAAF